ncbi:dihydrolipoyl dehydrogenase [Clostridia bacterium]|nr:dihydrolipoyl dehydrogenase [Clostridia bacterium]
MKYDIAVVGGGPAGYTAALHGSSLGAKVVLFEENKPGGVCLNSGCIPTKTYLFQSELLEHIRLATEEGVFRDAGQYSFKKIYDRKNKVVEKLVSGVDGLLRTAGVTVVRESAVCKDAHTIVAGGETYKTKKLILATGSKNAVLPIDGITGRNVLDHVGALDLKRLPQRLVIIGAGVVGLELACVFSSFDVQVTLLEAMNDLLPNVDGEAVQFLKNNMKKTGICLELGVKVLSIADDGDGKRVTCEYADGKKEFMADYVISAVGRAPTNQIALNLGLKTDTKGFLAVNDRMQTSHADVYAAGDITGGYLLAHSAYAEAEIAVRNCLGEKEKVDLSVMPRCIFTMPTISEVGLNEAEARKAYQDIKTGKFPFAASGRAVSMGADSGFVKWIARADGSLLGCTIVGAPETSELISVAVVALQAHLKAEAFVPMIFPHPTLSESVKEGAMAVLGQALHVPNDTRRPEH